MVTMRTPVIVAMLLIVALATSLPVALYNAVSSSDVRAYITSRGPDGSIRMLSGSNTWINLCEYRTGAGSNTIPQDVITHHLGAQDSWTIIDMPFPFESGRIYTVTDGELDFGTNEPDARGFCTLTEPSVTNTGLANAWKNWGFMEFSYPNPGELYVNPTLVDFVGTPLAIRLETGEGNMDAKGLPSDAVQLMCDGLVAKAMEEGAVPWGNLCVRTPDGSLLRVLSASHFEEADMILLATYYEQHVDNVWTVYTDRSLIIHTQTEHGNVQCQVRGDVLVCDSETFSKPSTRDILSCASGPFANEGSSLRKAVAARLCAAFHRGTLLIEGGHEQPSVGREMYYTASPSNWYSAEVHRLALDGKGYGFPYDDVTPDGDDNLSGTLAHNDVQKLVIGVGGQLPPP